VQLQHAPVVAVEAHRVEITELVVARGARRGGRGRALVEAALAWARERGAARVEVRVAARNAAGQAFWRSLGFGAFVDVLDRRL
jgi:GNAT superfamily N-acetyltransferase